MGRALVCGFLPTSPVLLAKFPRQRVIASLIGVAENAAASRIPHLGPWGACRRSPLLAGALFDGTRTNNKSLEQRRKWCNWKACRHQRASVERESL